MKMNHSSGEAGSDGVMANDKSSPKDAQVMISILKDLGIMDYEPRVLNQLLEFAYRYMTTVLDDAKMVSGHAKKKAVDVDDIKLAVQMYSEESLTSPPGRDILLETARTRNALPLPLPKPTCGLRLPPERFCITGSNFRLGKISKKKTASTGKGTFSNQSTPKMLVAPAGSTVIQGMAGFGVQQQKIKLDNTSSAMPNIQIQPGSGVGGQPMFSLTINPSLMQTGVKRKASEMDLGDQ